MINLIFNRTYTLWTGAIIASLFLVNQREALLQRVNTMKGGYIDCVSDENCNDPKAITEAREYYMILAELYPNYGRGSEMQGICYLRLNQDKMAIKKFEEAIKQNPDLFWVSFELGKAYYRQGDYSRALKYFQDINAQDNITLIKKAALLPLQKFSSKTNELLLLSLVGFVNDIKLQSYQLKFGCMAHLEKDYSKKEMLSTIDALATNKPVLHPWGHIIQPLKEILYR